jgi:hypothetical protein
MLPPDKIIGLKDGGNHASECRTFLDHIIDYNTTKRAELERLWNRARLYDKNQQWLAPMLQGTGRLFFNWEPIRIRRGQRIFPMPTRNVYSPAMQDEVSRLIGVGAKPYIRVDDPAKEDGALKAKQILEDRNEKTDWGDDERIGAWHAANFGQWVEAVWWDVNLMKKLKGPVMEGVRCKSCALTLSSPVLPGGLKDSVMRAAPNAQGVQWRHENEDEEDVEPQYRADRCFRCSGQFDSYTPTREVYEKRKDDLGRPLFQEASEGEEKTGVVSPYSFFPGNQGIGYQKHADMEEYAIRTPRTIPYFKSHYANGHLVECGRDPEIFRHHPQVNQFGLAYALDNVWDNHNCEDRYVLKAGVDPDYPRGRMVIMAGRTLLFDGELFMPGTDVPWYDIAVAQWELLENEIWGKPLAIDMFSVQDNINSGLSLAMDIMYKWVSPKMVLPLGADLQFKGGEGSRYQGDIWTMDTRTLPTEALGKYPMFFGNEGNVGSLWQMWDRDREYVADASGARAAEIGNVSGEEMNYSALVFAASKSATRRKPRNEGLRRLKRHIFKGRLRLIAANYDEERLIHYRDDANRWQVAQIRGFALQNQTDVGFEDDPIVESGVALRASIEQARTMGTLRVAAEGGSWETDRKINRAIGLPEDLAEATNNQLDQASTEWRAFFEDEAGFAEPFVDREADDHLIHWQRHSHDLQGREAEDLKVELNKTRLPSGEPLSWAAVLRMVWQWEKLWTELSMKQQVLEKMTSDSGQMELAAMQQQAPALYLQTMMKIQAAQTALFGFPDALESQIEVVWHRLIAAALEPETLPGQMPVPVSFDSYSIPALKRLIRFKAHALAHLLLQKQASMGMAPGIPAGQGAPPAGAPPAGAPPAAPAPAGPAGIEAVA